MKKKKILLINALLHLPSNGLISDLYGNKLWDSGGFSAILGDSLEIDGSKWWSGKGKSVRNK